MMIVNKKKEASERLIVKLPKSVAEYFRKTFPHGKRSDFVVRCILDYRHQEEIGVMEGRLREVAQKRQRREV